MNLAKLLNHPFALRYLAVRSRFRRWLFGTPTRILEVLNTTMLLAWGVALIDDRVLELPAFAATWGAFGGQTNEWVAGLFLFAALFALVGALRRGPSGLKLSGYALQLGAVLWATVAINYLYTWPPLNPAAATHAVLSFLGWSAGGFLWERGSAASLR